MVWNVRTYQCVNFLRWKISSCERHYLFWVLNFADLYYLFLYLLMTSFFPYLWYSGTYCNKELRRDKLLWKFERACKQLSENRGTFKRKSLECSVSLDIKTREMQNSLRPRNSLPQNYFSEHNLPNLIPAKISTFKATSVCWLFVSKMQTNKSVC